MEQRKILEARRKTRMSCWRATEVEICWCLETRKRAKEKRATPMRSPLILVVMKMSVMELMAIRWQERKVLNAKRAISLDLVNLVNDGGERCKHQFSSLGQNIVRTRTYLLPPAPGS